MKASDGSWLEAHEKLAGAPSVLFDAVALLVSDEGADALKHEPAARDFVSDAFAHNKFIAYVEAAAPLLERAADAGLLPLEGPAACREFVQKCRELRCWNREEAKREDRSESLRGEERSLRS